MIDALPNGWVKATLGDVCLPVAKVQFEDFPTTEFVLIQGPLIHPDFISFYLNSVAESYVELRKVGVAQSHFNTASVASLFVPLPPLAELAQSYAKCSIG